MEDIYKHGMWFRIFELCRENGVSKIYVPYNGSGDSGSVENPEFYPKSDFSLNEQLTDFLCDTTYSLLEKYHCGWEINDGSFGNLVIDCNTGQVTLEHNDYYTESNYTETPINHGAPISPLTE